MTRRITFIVVVIALVVSLWTLSNRRNIDSYEYLSHCKTPIWVEYVDGFMRPGNLSREGFAVILRPMTSVPRKTKIKWRNADDPTGPLQTAEVDLGSLKRRPDEKMLIFEFQSDQTWTATYAKEPKYVFDFSEEAKSP